MNNNDSLPFVEGKSNQELPGMPDTFRTFFAIPIPTELGEKIAVIIQPIRHLQPCREAKWTKPEYLHITLRFLGNINIDQYTQIVSQVAQILHPTPAFTVALSTLCPFPDAYSPDILMLKPQPLARLKELAMMIDKIVVANGIKPEDKPFVPHVTIAKFNQGRPRLSSAMVARLTLNNLLKMNLLVNEVILYRSVPGRFGTHYVELSKFVLQ